MELVGWAGTLTLLLSYGLFVGGKVDMSIYLGLNCVGSLLSLTYSVHRRAVPIAVVNAVFALIAVWGLM